MRREALVLMLALSGCAGPAGGAAAGPLASAPGSAGARPDWVAGGVGLYPASRYVTGVGEGDDRTPAEDRARAKVAAVFRTEIVARTSSVQEETAASRGDGPAQVTRAEGARQEVEATARKALVGVEIAEVWQDPDTRRVFALAALDRARAREALLSRLAAADAAAAPWLSRLAAADGRLARASAAGRLAALARGREPVLEDLRVVAPSERPGSTVDWPAASAAAERALSELVVTVALAGPAGEAATTGAVSGLAALHLQAAPAGAADPDLAVTGEASVAEGEPDRRNGPWKEARATATVTLADARTGKALRRFEVTDRQLSGQQPEAARRALAELGKKVAAGVKAAIEAQLAGE
ncbi:LPP20 family lipoprotein [Anaeromyxobacter paludicola]|uniref:Lipoprotein LPP20-like domain-containing protein n=1 Tax=Anaeromyxobacter paludicola TaxID=2918171 RepID=A0ABM7X9E5_9BACT|nr:LPP20 family lipoprotein [Anaeromyxobacter paludicola]BDG08476.1 hypothetical protein AMPC_15890 [Anaeromyxobacter paludicola]